MVGFGGDERLGRGEGGYGGFTKGVSRAGLVSRRIIRCDPALLLQNSSRGIVAV